MALIWECARGPGRPKQTRIRLKSRDRNHFDESPSLGRYFFLPALASASRRAALRAPPAGPATTPSPSPGSESTVTVTLGTLTPRRSLSQCARRRTPLSPPRAAGSPPGTVRRPRESLTRCRHAFDMYHALRAPFRTRMSFFGKKSRSLRDSNTSPRELQSRALPHYSCFL